MIKTRSSPEHKLRVKLTNASSQIRNVFIRLKVPFADFSHKLNESSFSTENEFLKDIREEISKAIVFCQQKDRETSKRSKRPLPHIDYQALFDDLYNVTVNNLNGEDGHGEKTEPPRRKRKSSLRKEEETDSNDHVGDKITSDEPVVEEKEQQKVKSPSPEKKSTKKVSPEKKTLKEERSDEMKKDESKKKKSDKKKVKGEKCHEAPKIKQKKEEQVTDEEPQQSEKDAKSQKEEDEKKTKPKQKTTQKRKREVEEEKIENSEKSEPEPKRMRRSTRISNLQIAKYADDEDEEDSDDDYVDEDNLPDYEEPPPNIIVTEHEEPPKPILKTPTKDTARNEEEDDQEQISTPNRSVRFPKEAIEYSQEFSCPICQRKFTRYLMKAHMSIKHYRNDPALQAQRPKFLKLLAKQEKEYLKTKHDPLTAMEEANGNGKIVKQTKKKTTTKTTKAKSDKSKIVKKQKTKKKTRKTK